MLQKQARIYRDFNGVVTLRSRFVNVPRIRVHVHGGGWTTQWVAGRALERWMKQGLDFPNKGVYYNPLIVDLGMCTCTF